MYVLGRGPHDVHVVPGGGRQEWMRVRVVVADHHPGQRAAGQRPVLGVACEARQRDRLADRRSAVPQPGSRSVTAGGSLPGRILTVAVSSPPRPSDTLNVAVNIPACVYVWLTLAAARGRGAVAEVPLVRERVAVRVGALTAVELDRERHGPGPWRGSAIASGLRFALPT